MLWRRFRDWRERRAALTELESIARGEEARLLDRNDNPLARAADCLGMNKFEEAIAHWELARTLLPDAIRSSPVALDILCGLKRYDEAEALMRDRQARNPRDSFAPQGLARIAEARGDMEEALARWRAFRDRFSKRGDGYYACARCLLALGRLDEAERESDRSIRISSASLDGWVVRAIVSDRRGDLEESIARWKKLTETHRFKPGFARAASAMIQLGRIDEAETYLAEPARLFGDDLEIALVRAQLAERRGDLIAACERWAVVRRGNPHFAAGYFDGARCLLGAERYDDADAVMCEAMERFPDESWPTRDFARVAHVRGDTREAAARWTMLQTRFPGGDAGFIPDAATLKAAAGETDPSGFFGG